VSHWCPACLIIFYGTGLWTKGALLLKPHSQPSALFFSSFLLTYVNYTKGFHCDIYNMHIMYFDQIHPILLLFINPPLYFSYFSKEVLCFWPGGLDHVSPTYTFHIAGMTGTHHHAWLISWDGVSIHFCLSWTQIATLMIAASPVAEITGAYHHAWHRGEL
jgi:hypothetical protein